MPDFDICCAATLTAGCILAIATISVIFIIIVVSGW